MGYTPGFICISIFPLVIYGYISVEKEVKPQYNIYHHIDQIRSIRNNIDRQSSYSTAHKDMGYFLSKQDKIDGIKTDDISPLRVSNAKEELSD